MQDEVTRKMMLLDSEDEDANSDDGEDRAASRSRSRSCSASGFRQNSGGTADRPGEAYEDSEEEDSRHDDSSGAEEEVQALKGKELEKIMTIKTENKQTLYLMKFKGALRHLCQCTCTSTWNEAHERSIVAMFHATLRCHHLVHP